MGGVGEGVEWRGVRGVEGVFGDLPEDAPKRPCKRPCNWLWRWASGSSIRRILGFYIYRYVIICITC